jgi:hypothetical protein
MLAKPLLRRSGSMRAFVFSASLLVAFSVAVLAQPYTAGGGTVLSPLPSPGVPESGRASDYLRAAQSALVAGRNGAAQEALEMAQTRMLDRSVSQGQTNNPSDNPTVGQIAQALQALAARDRANCLRMIQAAIETATAQGL